MIKLKEGLYQQHQIPMTTLQSKMAKSLQNHTLQNLVFEKRQRKTIQQSLIINTQPLPQKKKKINRNESKSSSKKQIKTNKQKKDKSMKTKKIQKLKDKKGRKYLTSKDLSKNKKKRQKELKDKQSKNIKSLNNKNKNLINKYKSKTRKSIKSQKISQKDTYNAKQKQILSSKQKPKSFSSNNKKNLNLSEQQNNKKEVQSIQEKIQIPSQPPKKKGRPRKIIQPVQSNLQNQNELEIDLQNKKLQNQKSEIKCRALLNLMEGDSKKYIQSQQSLPRSRQAKLNALKKYTQKDLHEDSFEYEKVIVQKKKRIHKNHTNQTYSINRIFRKQPKLDLNPINIDVKIDQLSFNAFVQKFGTFDIVHCSLPLSFLWQLTQIQNLMVKGFIFIWVQRGQTSLAYHLMHRLGYDVIDQIVWIKSNQSVRTVYNEPITQQQPFCYQQNLFMNAKSVCFVGYKCPSGQKAEYRTKISNNIIFSTPNFLQPKSKPSQIYEIADLLMPGAKKIQIGGYPQKGWLSLKHHQTRLRKCFTCLTQLKQKSFRIFESDKYNCILSICEKCFSKVDQKQDKQNQQSEQQSSQDQITEKESIRVNKLQYTDQSINYTCKTCKNTNFSTQVQLFACSCLKNQDSSLIICKNCFNKDFKKHLKHEISTINVSKEKYIDKFQVNCSSCQKKTLAGSYYECVSSVCRNKKHILCRECFWKQGYQAITDSSGQFLDTKKKNDNIHEWRKRKIVNYPLQKLLCVCKKQLILPYYVCQTCVGFKWCGKCKLNQNDSQNHEYNLENEKNNGNILSQKHKFTLLC